MSASSWSLSGTRFTPALEHLERAGVDDRGGAGPVVADPHHVAQAGRACGASAGVGRAARQRSRRASGAAAGRASRARSGSTSHARSTTVRASRETRVTSLRCSRITDEPWPNSPWLAVMPTLAPSTWRPVGLPAQLPGHLAHLGQRLGGNGLAEAGQPTARVDRDPAADRGVAGAQQRARPRPACTARGPRSSRARARWRGRRPRPGSTSSGLDAGLLVRRGADRLLEGLVGRRRPPRPGRSRAAACR